jgi:transposase
MSRVSNELRNVFLRLHKQKQKPIEIAKTLNITRQTITNWIRLLKIQSEEYFLTIRTPSDSKTPIVNEVQLKELFSRYKTATNLQIAQMTDLSKTTIHKHRTRYGYTYKVASKTYKQSDPELKKTS